MGFARLCAVAAAALLAVACTAYEWRNPNVPETRWRRDEADCGRRAAARVEEEAAREERYGGAGGGAGVRDDGATVRETMMARFEMKKRHARLVENCMKARGYARVKAE